MVEPWSLVVSTWLNFCWHQLLTATIRRLYTYFNWRGFVWACTVDNSTGCCTAMQGPWSLLGCTAASRIVDEGGKLHLSELKKLPFFHSTYCICVGGSKELTVLYESYSTAAFVLQQGFVLYKLVIAWTVCAVWVIKHSVWGLEAPYNTRLRLMLYGPLDPTLCALLLIQHSCPCWSITEQIYWFTYSLTN